MTPLPATALPALETDAPLGSTDGTDDIWVELPADESKPAKAKRSRRRGGKAAEPVSTDVAETEPSVTSDFDDVVVRAAEPAAPAAEPALEVVPESETVTETLVADAAAEPVVAAFDPAEIAAPPTKPKRGWWRRG